MAEIVASDGLIDNRNKKKNNYLHFNHNSRRWNNGIPDKEAYIAWARAMGYPLETAQKAYKYFEPQAVNDASN